MSSTPEVAAEVMHRFEVSLPTRVADTPIASVWKVVQADGKFAALKIYKNLDMRNEATGFAFTAALAGNAAVKLLDMADGMVLLEWLDGPSLGDLTRSGNDSQATLELVAVANQLHATTIAVAGALPRLDEGFAALFHIQFTHRCAASVVRDLVHCQRVARRLLATQVEVRPLHGDLHHDNVRRGERGYCAFDAKGVLGERTYELANAFRNPKRAADIVRNPVRARFLADAWSEAFGVERRRLLEWAMVKTALSIAWRCGGTLEDDPELELLAMLRGIVDSG